MTAYTASEARRFPAIDVARALAVIGVVASHSIFGLEAAGLIDRPSALTGLNDILYMFRMPALALVLGMFIPGGVEKLGLGAYLKRRTLLVVWVWILWTLLQGTVQVLLSSYTSNPITFGRVLQLWRPIDPFWFLPFLVVATAVVAVTRPWGAGLTPALKLGGLAVTGVILWGMTPNLAGVRGAELISFVALGAYIGKDGFGKSTQNRPVLWGLAALGGAAVLAGGYVLGAVPATTFTTPDLMTRLISVASAAGGVALLLGVSALVARVPLAGVMFCAVGQLTLPIYVMHFMVVAGARIVLARLGLDAGAILAIAVVLGVLVPYMVGRFSGPLHVNWLFELPAAVRQRLQVPSRGTRA